MNKGFKSSSCKDKNCLGCSATPPTISPKVIRNLGVTCCGINLDELSLAKLQEKPKHKKGGKSRKNEPSTSQGPSASDEASHN